MATYSAFFSSGLLAPGIARCTTPLTPASPVPASPVDPVDRHLSVTPTPISPSPRAPDSHSHAERPRMRRRRSSINIAASPMSHIKSPVRNAGAALQRTGIMSPSRTRAATVSMNEASENNSLFGRLRSGSVGGVVNPPKRRIRRPVRRTVPLAPPPTAPLPALPPPSPITKCAGSLLPPAILVPRQPLASRTLLTDNIGNLFSPTLPSPTLLSPDYTPKASFHLLPPAIPDHSRPCNDTIDERMQED